MSRSYPSRTFEQRWKRKKKKSQFQYTVTHELPLDSDSDLKSVDDENIDYNNALFSNYTTISNSPRLKILTRDDYDDYSPDEVDHVYPTLEKTFLNNDANLLYLGAPVTTNDTVTRLLTFSKNANFDRQQLLQMMSTIKSILPTPNFLPISFKQILKVFGKIPSYTAKYYCNKCWSISSKTCGQYWCTNSSCTLFRRQLSSRQFTEIVSMNLRDQIQSTIRRNFSLLTGNNNLFPEFDISRSHRYRTRTENVIHPITLCIHTDGAPLIRSTKVALWPCFATIAEIPPPIREYQSNILTLALWVSSVKPDVNIFLHDVIDQLETLSRNGTSIFVGEHEFNIHIKTLFFVSDLPAKSLFMKTINYNGYFACTTCSTEGQLFNKQVLYPYHTKNYRLRTHEEFVATAKEVEARSTNSNGTNHSTSINGVKGLSPLLKIFRYPTDIIYDYMHLVCLNHVPALIKRFVDVLPKNNINEIDSALSSVRLPHDVDLKYVYSIESVHDWKAKHARLFVLNVGLPILLKHLPKSMISHFSIYCLLVKMLHCPRHMDEIRLAEKLVHFYCETSSKVYDKKIELYSLHAHLHLPEQVSNHGGLAFTSSFCFESAIRYVKQKAHGTKNLGSQIAYWIEVNSIVPGEEFQAPESRLVNEIQVTNDSLDDYRDVLLRQLVDFQQNLDEIKLFLRFKHQFSTYHSLLYGKRYMCRSYLVSFNDAQADIQYGIIVVFYLSKNISYACIQRYKRAPSKISDELEVPSELKEHIDSFYPLFYLDNEFCSIPTHQIVNKCISIPVNGYECVTDRRVNHEHD